MTPSDVIQLIGIIAALAVGIISIVISVFSLRQNSKMLEESTRPVISIYGAMTNIGISQHYLVIKNFGQTPATITKFDYDFDFLNQHAYAGKSDTDWLKSLVTANLSPGQSMICALNYENINKPVTFTIEYITQTKTYNEQLKVNLRAGVAMLTSKNDGIHGDPVNTISYTLQEILQKEL